MTKIIFYYQTFKTLDNKIIPLDPILYENTKVTHIHVSAIHFALDSNNEPYIHLNNRSPYNCYFDEVWETIELAHQKNIKIVLMIGGAGTAFTNLFNNFDIYYDLLYNLLKNKTFISGVDLDIEEICDLDNIKKLINKLVYDFGKDFIITVAPVLESLINDTPGLSGFIYKNLLNSMEGSYITYINCQAYNNFTLDAYDSIINNGYKPEQIVMGMISGEQYQAELKKISDKYTTYFGGIFIWEYYNALPSPLTWCKTVSALIYPPSDSKCIVS